MKIIDRTETSLDVDVARRPSLMRRRSSRLDLHALPLADLVEVPLYRGWTIVTCLAVSFLIGWLAILLWPRTYVSYAELLFQVGRETVALDPTVTTGPTLLLQKSQEEDINSALQILQSRRVLEMVAERLGDDAILSDSLPTSTSESQVGSWGPWKAGLREVVDDATLGLGLRDELSSRELAVMKLIGAVRFEAPRKSSVVTIEATARTPEMAQAIAGGVVDCFLQLHNEALQTKGSREFFLSQTASATARLLEAQETRRRFLESRRAVSLEARHEVLKQQLASVEIELLNTRRELEQAIARSQKLNQDVKSLEDTTISGQQDIAATMWGNLRQRVYELELQEAREAAKFADGYPRLEATRRELGSAREILENFQNSTQRDVSLAPNPLKQKLQEEMAINDAIIAGLQSALLELAKQNEQLEGEVATQLAAELELAKIDRDIEAFSNSLRLLREKEEEARVIHELRSEGISSVSQFQPATLVQRPISPNKKLLMAGYLLMGFVVGVGLTYVQEIRSRVFRLPTLAAQHTELPVLAELPTRARLRSAKSLLDAVRESDDWLRVSQAVWTEVFGRTRGVSQVSTGLTIGVIGIEPGNGASTLALALAASGSEDYQLPTVLVELDRQRRTITHEFGLEGLPGLVDFAAGRCDVSQCLQPAYRQLLSVVAYSAAIENSEAASVGCEALQGGLRQIQAAGELTVVKLPSVTCPERTVSLAQQLDFLVLVVESGRSSLDTANRFLRTLSNSDVCPVGMVLNKAKRSWLATFLKVR